MLNPITTVEEIHELVQLGGRLQNVIPENGVADDIIWKWTENGHYSRKCAYLAQFQGLTTNTNYEPLWSTTAEPKRCFFGWLVLHQKTLTVENLLRQYWPCDWIFSLCTNSFEDTTHLAKKCSFTVVVWNHMCNCMDILVPQPQMAHTIEDWWSELCKVVPKARRTQVLGALLTTWWNVWLERNRRIFQHLSKNELQVTLLVKVLILLELLFSLDIFHFPKRPLYGSVFLLLIYAANLLVFHV